MDIKKEFGTNKKAEVEGVWRQLDDKTWLLIARANNDQAVVEYARLRNLHKEEVGSVHELKRRDAEREIMIKVMAKAILVGWHGLDFDGRQDLPYSQADAELLLRIDDFRDVVNQLSLQWQEFLIDAVEASAKNFATASSGKTSGVTME